MIPPRKYETQLVVARREKQNHKGHQYPTLCVMCHKPNLKDKIVVSILIVPECVCAEYVSGRPSADINVTAGPMEYNPGSTRMNRVQSADRRKGYTKKNCPGKQE